MDPKSELERRRRAAMDEWDEWMAADEAEARGNVVRAKQLRKIAEHYGPESGYAWRGTLIGLLVMLVLTFAVLLIVLAVAGQGG